MTAANRPSAEELRSRPKVIEVDHLDFSFGTRQVLFDIDLDVREGEIMVIMGGSGSGKTTLLRHLVGLMPPQPGRVRLLGRDLGQLKGRKLLDLKRRIGVAFQFGALFSSLSVAENVKLPLRELTDLEERTMDIMANMKLEVCNLSGFGHLMPSDLSGGMMKRASIARAIVMDPKLVFLDEPSSGLDPVVSSALDDLILKLRDAMDISVVVVSHDVESAFKIADRITILDKGHILISDRVEAVRNSPNERVQNLLHRRSEQIDLDPTEYLRRLAGD
ncbi:phospholipid/cholesterol/gamma-HCH transport system ATP-binding protein [Dongia mobilis]|uniref:Phospholipid/cholesterol/gamma-HCH transport system ATP-binding protein n=2 Tax=Dongia mobilis TaxID=578943 RepID=A0A4R6WTA7_9PROT|nr:phospholipid/cholesterol/gamma-HCH transport system ATP-binding protein [Dongia mobilis]